MERPAEAAEPPRTSPPLRIDPHSGRSVVIAPRRASRPGQTRPPAEAPSEGELESCPFCEGREERTPPEALALPQSSRAPDSPGWQVRVVPNLYPAFERQEVVVHSPRHVRSIVELAPDELGVVAAAWQARARAAAEAGFDYVHALVNEGRAAGATLAHSHSQLVWLREVPPLPAREQALSAGRCVLCDDLASERAEGTRVVSERDGVVSLCPAASREPYELLVAPTRHEPDAWTSARLATALELLAEGWRRLRSLEGGVPANAWLHAAPFGGEGHWHLEALPRLTTPAGVELGAGVFVNPLDPDAAAQALRTATP